ncbi:VapE domain-containing protein [uncultured Flavobacterium sp.]|uniref:VapE domain-containing protein n=1 Tax=uncultured Flavobacterium sp. TaxID=165435 RepID=UPI00374A2F2D
MRINKVKKMLEQYLNERYTFKFNEILNRTYYLDNETKGDFLLLKDYKLNSIKRELNNASISATKSDLKCLLESDYVINQNPFKDYFNSLPKWDMKKDYILELCKTVQTTNQEDFYWAFKKWIVATVACSIYENVTNQTVLILTGKQGIGKTSWFQKLMPNALKEYFYSGIINPNNKDTTLLMSEKFLINLDELASLNKKQIEAFKEMITKSTITERRAYAHFTEDYIRRASFVGSSNHNEILMDVTGNRRFLCFEATEIDYEHKINMDYVYSQAVYLLNNKEFIYHFDKQDVLRLEENNKMFVQSSEEVNWIEELFSLPHNDANIEYMNATEIKEYIKLHKGQYINIDVQQIGKIMTSKNFQTKKISGGKKYKVNKNKG